MGLDVYVGSLTRYYAGQWETIVQQAGRQIGFDVQVVRTQPEAGAAITDPDEIRTGILRWRTALGQALAKAGLDGLDLNWREDLASPVLHGQARLGLLWGAAALGGIRGDAVPCAAAVGR
jgi:hypothetical protein